MLNCLEMQSAGVAQTLVPNLSIARAVLNLCVSRKIFLKHQVNWNTVCGAIQDLPCCNIWSADNPVNVLNKHLLLLVIRVHKKDKPWFDNQCRYAFGLKHEAYLRWTRDRSLVNWEEFVSCHVRTNGTYSEASRQISGINRDVLMNAQSSHKCWSTLKCAVFGLSSSLPPFVGGCGGLVCESVGKADLSIILTASIALPLFVDFPLRDLPPLPSGQVRSGVACYTWTLMEALTHLVCFLFILRVLLMFWPSVLV